MRASNYSCLATEKPLLDKWYATDVTDSSLSFVVPHVIDQWINIGFQSCVYASDVFARMLEIAHHVGEAIEVIHRLQTG